jgi:hypothetical protein
MEIREQAAENRPAMSQLAMFSLFAALALALAGSALTETVGGCEPRINGECRTCLH